MVTIAKAIVNAIHSYFWICCNGYPEWISDGFVDDVGQFVLSKSATVISMSWISPLRDATALIPKETSRYKSKSKNQFLSLIFIANHSI